MRRKKIWKLIGIVVLSYFLTIVFRAVNIHKTWHVEIQEVKEGHFSTLYPIYYLPAREVKGLTKDSNGVYMMDRAEKGNLSAGDEVFYSPISIGLASLKDLQQANEHGDSLALKSFLINATWLKTHQDSLGRLAFDVPLRTLDKNLEPPWYSALGQAFALSIFPRAFEITRDSAFYHAADKALIPLTMTIREGGVKSFSEEFGPFLEEYPTDPPKRVFNGFNYVLLGLSDTASILNSSHADEILRRYLSVMEDKIHKFDLGSWSAYSLDEPNLKNHYTYCNPWYHKLHIVQLSSLYKMTGKEIFKNFAEEFRNDLKGPIPFVLNPAYVLYSDLIWINNLFK